MERIAAVRVFDGINVLGALLNRLFIMDGDRVSRAGERVSPLVIRPQLRLIRFCRQVKVSGERGTSVKEGRIRKVQSHNAVYDGVGTKFSRSDGDDAVGIVSNLKRRTVDRRSQIILE